MTQNQGVRRFQISLRVALFSLCLGLASTLDGTAVVAADPPVPQLTKGHPVDWWFVFKFNSASFPGCGAGAKRQCIFGGDVQDYKQFGQQFLYASSEDPSLQRGSGCAGGTVNDPVGATFSQIYTGTSYYVIWNDQFYDDPAIDGCSGNSCSAPWGHSKGMLAWNDAGEGLALQVTTPSWPAAGTKKFPRKTDGNTLGCVIDDNVKVSQHFFSLRLTKEDLAKVLIALANASVVTDIANRQVVYNGGPVEIQNLVRKLGKRSASTNYSKETLSSGVVLISKPSRLNVPPWQMVSALLDSVSLRTATWWANPKIDTTTGSPEVKCWDSTLAPPGAVEIAGHGQWAGTQFGLTGGSGPNFNHAKIGISTSGDRTYSIFGDMNQQGDISGTKCGSSQNGRGGLFYVLEDVTLFGGLKDLLAGDTAHIQPSN